ncbi:MAG: phosphomannomutase/phosphoglucomutase [Clostridia bacterium]|nr:phosphomannomutase/phosphoglucomutase [Clostridia bacterium]
MTIAKNIFRGYDIRGIYPTDLSLEAAELIGKGFATLMKRQGQTEIIVGRDVRLSSDALFEALAKGITSTGVNVINLGVCMTPMSYFARELLGIKPSVMITASHNPKEYNGLKICGLGSDTIYGEEIQDLRRFVEAGDFDEGEGQVIDRDIREDYLSYIVDKVKLGDKKVKVAVDAGNGVGGIFIEEFLQRLGIEDAVYTCIEPDGNFPNHHPDPSQEKNMLAFEKFVVDNHCDIGISFDGDADRIICFDENGKILFGDEFMIIIWRDLIKKYPGAEGILDVKCTQSLYEEIEKIGGKPRFVKVGSPFIKAEIREKNLIFAGEYAGHIYFNDEYYGFDDSYYSAARILKILTNTDKKMSELLDGVKRYVGTPEQFVMLTDETKNEVVEKVKETFFEEGYEVIDVDGARVLFGNGWGLVRCSNTEPKLTIKAEADTKENVEAIMDKINAVIRNAMK